MLRSFDDLDTPLHQVTFCVVDLETTGASASTCDITEVGAARFRGGECLGTFQTLVCPGAPIEPAVAALTGITDAMVRAAPPVSQVLPSLAEFVGGAVLVGHNLRFDVSFLDAALTAGARERVGLRTVDTVALARRLVRDDVPDCRLATLAHVLGLDHQPTHRALDDALATADLLHILLERAAGFGVSLLDDLVRFPRLAAHPQAAKLHLTNDLPRSPGVYVLRDGQGRALHVAGADDVRAQVRGLFSGDDQRGNGPLVRELHAIDHLAVATSLAARVAEVRLTHALRPRRGRPGADATRHRYVRLGAGRGARLTVSRTPAAGRARYLGPLPSAAHARAVIDATTAAAAATEVEDEPPGSLATVEPADLFDDPGRVLDRLRALAADARRAGRPAQARALDEMGTDVAAVVRRQRQVDALRRAGRVRLQLAGGEAIELDRGRLVHDWRGDHARPRRPGDLHHVLEAATPGPVPDDGPLPPALADELACVAGWLDRHAGAVRLRDVGGELSSVVPAPVGPAAPAAGLRCAAC